MSYVNLALPGCAVESGFRGTSALLRDFCRLGDFAIGSLPENRGLFTWQGEQATTARGADCACLPLGLDEPVLEGTIIRFLPDSEEEVACPPGPNQFLAMLSTMIPSPNYGYAVRVRGLFTRIRVTSLPGYAPRSELTEQTVCSLETVRGVLLGFYFPSLLEHSAWAGYRIHFLADDGSTGGRLIDCEIERPHLSIQHVNECRIALPATSDFQLTDF